MISHRAHPRRWLLSSASVAVAFIALSSFGENARAADPADVPSAAPEEDAHAIDRTWLYADDARVAAPMAVIAMASTSYTNVGSDPFRVGAVTLPTKYSAFDGNTAQPGFMMGIGGEIGLLPRVSVMALGELALGGVNGSANPGAIAGIRFQLTPPSWKNLHVAASGGYLREAWQGPTYDDDNNRWTGGNPHGDNGMWFQGAISGDIGRARLVGNVHAEHIFTDGRDALDVMVNLGATYRIAGAFRAGVEWVGQDLEEVFTPGAEGGARMFVGPTAALQLLDNHLTLAGGPSLGLSQASGQAPNFIGRVSAAYGF